MNRITVIESPYQGTSEQVAANVRYARACVLDSIRRGEAPFASHLLYTQPGVLNDGDVFERRLGIRTGFAFYEAAKVSAVYVDRGLTDGMYRGAYAGHVAGACVEVRTLGAHPPITVLATVGCDEKTFRDALKDAATRLNAGHAIRAEYEAERARKADTAT